MAVEVRYLVIRDGKEVGMYTTKKEADAHDKMLDIAENLFTFIENATHIGFNEGQIEELSIYFAQNRDTAMKLLKGATFEQLQAPSSPKSPPPSPATKGKQSRRGAKKK